MVILLMCKNYETKLSFPIGSTTYSWLQPGTSKGIIKRPAEGRRLVVVHAGTRGFVPGTCVLSFHDIMYKLRHVYEL